MINEDATVICRRAIGILLYLGADRWDVKRDTELAARHLKEPREFDWRRIVRITKYLKGKPAWGHELRGDNGLAGKIMLDMYSDTDYAPDDTTKRAMSCGQIYIDKMPYGCFARRQGVQSTSSGEAEFYGASSTAMD